MASDDRALLEELRRIDELEQRAGGSSAAPKAAAPPREPTTAMDYVKGTGQVARSIAENAVLGAEHFYRSAMGEPGPEFAKVTGMRPPRPPSFTPYTPTMPGAQSVMDVLTWPGRMYGKGSQAIGDWVGKQTAPHVGELTSEAINIAPWVAPALYSALRGGPNPAIARAKEAGFRLTPKEGGGGPISQTGASVAGEPRLARLINERNAATVEAKVAQDVGLPKGVPVTHDELGILKARAGQSYEVARNTGVVTPGKPWQADLAAIERRMVPSPSDFGGTINPAIRAELKVLSDAKTFDASSAITKIASLREQANGAFRQGLGGTGKAYSDMAKALEIEMERHLVRTGQPADIISNYRASRVQIAKIYDAEKAIATGGGAGRLNPMVYGKKFAKGEPLTGPGLEIGEAASNFKRSMRVSNQMGTGPTLWDAVSGAAAGAGVGFSHGGIPGLAGGLAVAASRPLARYALASGAGQALQGAPVLRRAVQAGQVAGSWNQGDQAGPPERVPQEWVGKIQPGFVYEDTDTGEYVTVDAQGRLLRRAGP